MFQPRRYQVTGTQPVSVNGPIHMPGAVFEADIPPVQEARLIACGALRVIPMPEPKFPPRLDVEPPPNPEQADQGRDALLHTRRSE